MYCVRDDSSAAHAVGGCPTREARIMSFPASCRSGADPLPWWQSPQRTSPSSSAREHVTARVGETKSWTHPRATAVRCSSPFIQCVDTPRMPGHGKAAHCEPLAQSAHRRRATRIRRWWWRRASCRSRRRPSTALGPCVSLDHARRSANGAPPARVRARRCIAQCWRDSARQRARRMCRERYRYGRGRRALKPAAAHRRQKCAAVRDGGPCSQRRLGCGIRRGPRKAWRREAQRPHQLRWREAQGAQLGPRVQHPARPVTHRRRAA